jgi:hypothetical protein
MFAPNSVSSWPNLLAAPSPRAPSSSFVQPGAEARHACRQLAAEGQRDCLPWTTTGQLSVSRGTLLRTPGPSIDFSRPEGNSNREAVSYPWAARLAGEPARPWPEAGQAVAAPSRPQAGGTLASRCLPHSDGWSPVTRGLSPEELPVRPAPLKREEKNTGVQKSDGLGNIDESAVRRKRITPFHENGRRLSRRLLRPHEGTNN